MDPNTILSVLHPGELLTSRRISLRLGVSRKAVKWALRLLERTNQVGKQVRAPLSIDNKIVWTTI